MRRLIALFMTVSLLTAISFMTSSVSLFKTSYEKGFEPVFQRGMSYRPASYPNYYPYDSPESDESLRRMAETGVEWVAIITWWFQENLTSTRIYPHEDYTPTDEALKHAIQKAHELKMKVMLKPMVDTEDARNYPRWKIEPSHEWFASYKAFIVSHAKFAQENDVELFSIGCEFKTTENWAASWREIISEVRKHYSGPLTYAATIDSYKHITWWDNLDYVGINAFFPLTEKDDPTLEELRRAWNNITSGIESWQSTANKPILFTEIGYRSGNGNSMEPWNWTVTLEPDLQEQFDCYLAAFQTLWNKPWFYGFYWWIWESYPYMALPSYDKAYNQTITDFTPQNKPVQYLIKSWYSSERQTDSESEIETLEELVNELQRNYSVLKNLLHVFVATTFFLALVITVYFIKSRKQSSANKTDVTPVKAAGNTH
jgi:hypothetical protein